ncbi:hypothetical protein O3M35_000320 [Rhynocoris fuscipes]|uniref:THAP-type domain-containing protein n=1 Tax=Rhynocoris fuscipes TaxID=488301 RepID=A0AAW1DN43_9HEMI
MDNNTEVTENSKFHCCIPNCTYSKGSFFRIPNGNALEWDNLIKTEFPNFIYDINHRICSKHFSHFNFRLSHRKILRFSESYNNRSLFLNNRNGSRMSPGAEETALRLQSPEHVIEISTTEGLPSPLREIIAETDVDESFSSSGFQNSHNLFNEYQSGLEKSISIEHETSSNNYRSEKEVRYTKCCIPNCTTSRKTNRNAHLFLFPKLKLSEWIDKIKAHHSDYVYKNYHRICSKHFSDSNFTSTLYTRLSKFAYPNIFGDNLPDRSSGPTIYNSDRLLPDPGHRIQKDDAPKNSLDSFQNISEIRADTFPRSKCRNVVTIPPNVNTNSCNNKNKMTAIDLVSTLRQNKRARDCYSVSSQNNIKTSPSDNMPSQDLNRINQEKVSQNNLILSSKENEFHPNDKIHYPESSTVNQELPESSTVNQELPESSTVNQELPESSTADQVSPELPITDKTVAHNNDLPVANVNELRQNDDKTSSVIESSKADQAIYRQNNLVSSPIVNEISQHDNSHPLVTELSNNHPHIISQNNQVLSSNVYEVGQINILHPPTPESQQNNQKTFFQNNLVSSSDISDTMQSNNSQPPDIDQQILSQNNQVLSSNINELQPDPDSGSSKAHQETFPGNDLILHKIVDDARPVQSSKKRTKEKLSKKRTKETDKNSNNVICCVPNCGMSTFSNPEVHFFKFPQRKVMEWSNTIKSSFSSYSYRIQFLIETVVKEGV